MTEKLTLGALETSFEYRGVCIRVVQHENLKAMHAEIKLNYSDTGDDAYVEISKETEQVHAITLGQYVDKRAEITIFIPYSVSRSITADTVIPHEALHATLAIVRDEIANTIDPSAGVHIGDGKIWDEEIGEEFVCTICGEVSALISRALCSIQSFIEKGNAPWQN